MSPAAVEIPASDPGVAELRTCILDCLLPGGSQWPSAGRLGLTDRVAGALARMPQEEGLLGQIAAGMGESFVSFSPQERIVASQQLEAANAELVDRSVTATYNMSYTDARAQPYRTTHRIRVATAAAAKVSAGAF